MLSLGLVAITRIGKLSKSIWLKPLVHHIVCAVGKCDFWRARHTAQVGIPLRSGVWALTNATEAAMAMAENESFMLMIFVVEKGAGCGDE
jgi:hypothetical protein